MKSVLKSLGLVLVTFASSCAYMSHDIQIKPNLQVSSSTIGEGKEVDLKVVDEREDKNIGRRTDAYGMGAVITNDQDLETLFQEEIKMALENKNFKVVNIGNPSRALKIEIRSIKYTTSMGIVRGGFLANASMKVIARNGNEIYERMYRSSDEKKAFFIPVADSNRDQVNDAVTGVLRQIFDDKNLFEFLAK